MTTIRIVFNDYSGADLLITNMTTLPETGTGLGSESLQKLLAWAQAQNLRDIHATQISRVAQSFWSKNGFTRIEGPNPTSDYKYQAGS